MYNIPKVENMCSPNGNDVPNQFKIYTDEGVYFQSYDSIIAFKSVTGRVVLGKDWDYSRTTGKYRNMFLRENKAQTALKLAQGIYEYDPSL